MYVSPDIEILELQTEGVLCASNEKVEENEKKKARAMELCQEKIDNRGLEMKLIDVEYTFDNSKVIFYFTADGRVDFRELVKDLAAVFRMRIELRQIGVRDEAKMLGGIGSCGRPLCCSKWLSDFHPVSIKMAKQQNLSLNPSKISGTCGRLMCCLNFEDKTYKELRNGMPKDNERVETPDGLAKVVNVDYFNGKINTRAIEKDPETGEEVFSPEIHSFKKEEIKRIGKNAGKDRGDDITLEVMFDSNVNEEEARELEELMKEF
jgi:cell fate regulator YaaT (PSP1 superfamily)